MDERLKRQLDFTLEIDKEKNIFRQTHLSGHGRRENDAEHAWHMAIMAYLLREYANEPVDIAKAAIEHAAKNEFNIVILDTAGRLHIDDDMMEAAQSLGASRTEAFMKVIFPMSLPGIIVGGILVFTGTLTAYTTPQLLGGNSNMVMATLIYQRAMSVSDWTGASVIALIMIVVTLVVIKGFNALAARLDRRGEDYA